MSNTTFAQIIENVTLAAHILQLPMIHQILGGKFPKEIAKIFSLCIYLRSVTFLVTHFHKKHLAALKIRAEKKKAADEAQEKREMDAARPRPTPPVGVASLPAGSSDPHDLFADPESQHLFRLYAKPEHPRTDVPGDQLRDPAEVDTLRGWKVDTFDGVEELGKGFSFVARLVSESELFDLQRFIGKTLTVGVKQLHHSRWMQPAWESMRDPGEDQFIAPVEPADATERYFDGLVSQFSFDRSDGGAAYYSATLVPWTHLLTQDRDSRLFLGRTVPEVLRFVFDLYANEKKYGALIDFEFRLSASYKSVDVITQYDETYFEFVRRLLEREGLTSFFEHDKGKHRWVITDNTPLHCESLPGSASELRFDAARRIKAQAPGPRASLREPALLNSAGNDVFDLNMLLRSNFWPGGKAQAPDPQAAPEDLVSANHTVTDFAVVRTLQPAQVSVPGSYNANSPGAPLTANVPTLRRGVPNPHSDWNIVEPPYALGDRAAVQAMAERAMKRFESLVEYYVGSSDCPGLQSGRTFSLIGYFPPREDRPPDELSSKRLLLRKIEHSGRNNILIDRKTGAGRKAEYSNRFECQAAGVPFVPEVMHAKPRIAGVQRAIVTAPAGKEIHTDDHGCVKVRFLWDRYAPADDQSSGWVPVVHANDTMSIPHKDDWVLVAFPDLDHPVVIGTLVNAARPLPHHLEEHDRKGIWARSVGPGARQGYSEMTLGNQGGKELMRIRAQHNLEKTVHNNEVHNVHNDRNVTVHNNEFLSVLKGNVNIDVFKGSAMMRAKEGVRVESVSDSVLVRGGKAITITAADSITLVCGDSRIVMGPEGISIESKKVVVKGPEGIELN